MHVHGGYHITTPLLHTGTLKRVLANCVAPDQMQHNAVSDQGCHGLLKDIGISVKYY